MDLLFLKDYGHSEVIASVIIAFIYSLLADFSLPPTQRALIMLLVVALLWLWESAFR
ncbi:MAG: ComEC/Rec2 family competence protein [Francisella endosymbiont of Hyalomma scupense]